MKFQNQPCARAFCEGEGVFQVLRRVFPKHCLGKEVLSDEQALCDDEGYYILLQV
jgi:hypothetical protein